MPSLEPMHRDFETHKLELVVAEAAPTDPAPAPEVSRRRIQSQ
jgi:hypothetical protein